VETKEYNYLYPDGDSLVIMDNETFEQIYIDKVLLGESVNFIQHDDIINIWGEGSKIVYRINVKENGYSYELEYENKAPKSEADRVKWSLNELKKRVNDMKKNFSEFNGI
jgi:hypothetical protein